MSEEGKDAVTLSIRLETELPGGKDHASVERTLGTVNALSPCYAKCDTGTSQMDVFLETGSSVRNEDSQVPPRPRESEFPFQQDRSERKGPPTPFPFSGLPLGVFVTTAMALLGNWDLRKQKDEKNQVKFIQSLISPLEFSFHSLRQN